jgi:hypothetical protein
MTNGNDALHEAVTPNVDVDSQDAGDDESLKRLKVEIEAAAIAAASYIQKLAATASDEARLSVASTMAMATARSLSIAFLVLTWVCVLAMAIWYAIDAGWSPTLALAMAR